MATAASNRKNIMRNRKALFGLECQVTANKTNAYSTRSAIEENRALILKNYTAAFMGNRQLANQNTDDIFRNRRVILSSLDAQTDIQKNFVESSLNEASIDYLEHRADLNASVLEVNKMMAEVNEKLIEINSRIMKSNENIVAFNSKNLAINSKILASGLSTGTATSSSNAKRIARNKERLTKILKVAKSNASSILGLLKFASKNRAAIEKNAAGILARRKGIEDNRKIITQNQTKVSKIIS